MNGQMSLFDFIEDPEESRKKLRAEEAREELRKLSRRLDGLESVKPEPVQRTCRSCDHFHRATCGPRGIVHTMGCFGFGVSRSDDPGKPACTDWVEATDGEAWRTDDEALEAWKNRL